MPPRSRGWTSPTYRTLDALLAFWCVFWVVVGVLTGRAVWRLTELGDTLERSGVAIDEAGQALEGLGELPVVGDTTGEVGGEVRARAQDVVASARQARDDVQRLAFLLGGAVALLPTAPLLAVYLPGRLRFGRDVADVRRAAASEPAEAVDAWLAHRALVHLPLEALRRATPTPLADAREGRYADLAGAELARLGLRRSAPDRTPRP